MHLITVHRRPDGTFQTGLTNITGVRQKGSLKEIMHDAADNLGPNKSFTALMLFRRRGEKTRTFKTERAPIH